MRKTTIAVLAVLVLATAACSGKYKPGAGTTATDGDAQTGAAGQTGPEEDCADQTGGDATITVSGYAYDPTCLKVSASNGITIVNEDPSAHSFSVEGGVVDVTVDVGETGKVKSLSDLAPGTYSFNCHFHPPMVGTLIVE